MKTILFLATLSCPEIKMINKTDKPWNDFDYQHLEIAKKRCGEIYPNSVCVKQFIKRTESDFSVICGKKE